MMVDIHIFAQKSRVPLGFHQAMPNVAERIAGEWGVLLVRAVSAKGISDLVRVVGHRSSAARAFLLGRIVLFKTFLQLAVVPMSMDLLDE